MVKNNIKSIQFESGWNGNNPRIKVYFINEVAQGVDCAIIDMEDVQAIIKEHYDKGFELSLKPGQKIYRIKAVEQ